MRPPARASCACSRPPSSRCAAKAGASPSDMKPRNSGRRIIKDVTLGRDVKIYDFVNLYGCEIGDETKIGAFVEIQRGARIGRRVKVSTHTFICEGVQIEDHVFVGHGVMFINDRYPRAVTASGELQT